MGSWVRVPADGCEKKLLLHEIFFKDRALKSHKTSVATGQRRTTDATVYLSIDGLRPGFGLNKVIKSVAILTVEKRLAHDATHKSGNCGYPSPLVCEMRVTAP